MSSSQEKIIPLVRFHAGELELGFVAAAAERLYDVEPDCPHIAALLGLPGEAQAAEHRTVALYAYGKRTRILLNAPVRIKNLGVHDLLPTSGLVRRGLAGATLGFAREDQHIVLLLDVAWLVERAK